MPCTTLLVGKNASYDGSTMMARNEDSPSGEFTAKKFIVVRPEDQPRHYKSVISGVEFDLPDDPLRYTAVPNALPNEGIWGEAGINSMNVAMSETETITSNERVLGADPLVRGGIGEEDFLTIVLPYIHSAREGVQRLGMLLETWGTYEMNGIGFQDVDEIWWFETIGGHHWIARRGPDNCYVIMPNQQGIDAFDFVDAFTTQTNYMCSADLLDFIESNHLDLTLPLDDEVYDLAQETCFDVRAAFGSHSDSDHCYNTPRAWFAERYLNPASDVWDGPEPDYVPESDDLPWCRIPEHKVTVEDVKYVLSSYYQGTPYNPYSKHADPLTRGMYRPIGISRNNFLALTQLRPYMPDDCMALQWIAMGSNPFNAFVPFYANVEVTPAYFANTGAEVTTENFYWTNRIIGALADAHFQTCLVHIERYQMKLQSKGHELIRRFDREMLTHPAANVPAYLEACNQEIADEAEKATAEVLDKVLYTASMGMKNGFARSDN